SVHGVCTQGVPLRLMLIHADHFMFAVTARTSVADVVDGLASDERGGRVEEVLVAFTSVEKAHQAAPPAVAHQAVAETRATDDKARATRIMVYPYAHLSSDLARPQIAATVIDTITDTLRQDGVLEIHRAPFGYYKSYDIACKGHPLSELGMTILPGG